MIRQQICDLFGNMIVSTLLPAVPGGFTGLLPIGWSVLNVIFLQQLAEQHGSFKVLQDSLRWRRRACR